VFFFQKGMLSLRSSSPESLKLIVNTVAASPDKRKPDQICPGFLQPPVDIDHRNFHYLGVSKNNGIPKSSILIGFSTINHPFWGEYPFQTQNTLLAAAFQAS